MNAPRAIGKSLVRDPERAPLTQRAFEEYATARFTKEQLLKKVRAWGLTNRRGNPLTSQAIGVLLRNRLYAGIIDVPEYGVRGKCGDFESLISEECRRHSTNASGSNNSSFPTESRSTEIGLFEPAQLHRPSTTCGKSELKMNVWWT